MTTLSTFYRYKFDPTGVAASNLVIGEEISIPTATAVPIPLHEGMFYQSADKTSELVLRDKSTGAELTLDTDYTLIGLDHVLYARTGIECYAAFMLTDTSFVGSLTATYQAVGGVEGVATSFIKELRDAIETANAGLTVDWEDIKNLPTTFPPSLHEQPLSTLTGFEAFADELQKLTDTLVSRIPIANVL